MQDFQSLCQLRRSYRKYTNQAVEQEKLDYIDLVVNGCGLMNDTHLDLTIDINLVSFHIKIINKAHIIRIQIVFFFNLSVVLL